MKQVNTDEFLSWLGEQAEKWEERKELMENYYEGDVGHKYVAMGQALAMRSCVSKFKSLQSEVDNPPIIKNLDSSASRRYYILMVDCLRHRSCDEIHH